LKLINQTIIKNRCRFSFDNEPNGFGIKTFKENSSLENNWYYIKTDYLEEFLQKYQLDYPFHLFTGKSDINITDKYLYILDNPKILSWTAVNVDCLHPKLKSMPLGLMDNWWYEDGYSECGNNNLILEFLDRPKTKLVYCNFGIGTNPSETNKCKNVA